MKNNLWTRREGSPIPLGCTWIAEEEAFNFALYSKHATAVTLLLYRASDFETPSFSYAFDYRVNKSQRIWHCRLPLQSIGDCRFYAYQVDGPVDITRGQRFDKEKVLLDPYAKNVFFPPDFSRDAALRPGSNAGQAPLGELPLFQQEFDWEDDAPVFHTHDLVIYELHVRGFTRHDSSNIDTALRGTFAGVIEKIPYLKSLGVTAVELMPVFQFDPQENNYWGYMTLNFFSPNVQYASKQEDNGPINEFKSMVKALHKAGIEVILDVVYNHTAEGDENGPTYSYRAIDNTTYYLLAPLRSIYRNDTGTGNTLHTANRNVRQMILDSLRYWVCEMHVDGFRFDLASIFTRTSDGSVNLEDPPIISEITNDPTFRNIRVIAEAWDPATYQLGRNFPGLAWAQWNGKFRDTIRSFVKSDPGNVAQTMMRVYGSNDLFPDDLLNACHAYQSINYVSAHDGFNLNDLVTYNNKHNHANGHNNTDGSIDNLSWNCGWEGEEGASPEVKLLRRKQVRNFVALLMLSNGIPMFTAGDEFLHTQKGNNNPYNQDNDTTWLDWSRLENNQDIFRFFRKMIAFRKRHPSICRSRFWREDVQWFGLMGKPDLSVDSRSFAFLVKGAGEQDKDIYVMVNAYWQKLEFSVPGPAVWLRIVDTAKASPEDIMDSENAGTLDSAVYALEPRSVVVLESR